MIPKIIHMCWLSGDPFPPEIQKCLDTWKVHLLDYEVVLWDRNRFDVNSVLWTKQAFENKKYAFAADYIRLYALYTYGGIYLDSDIIMYKSFDDLLDLPYFIGTQYTEGFEAAVIGTEPGNPFIKTILDRYKGRSFVKDDGSFDTLSLPRVFLEVLTPLYRFKKIYEKEGYSNDERIITVFSRDFFNSRDAIGVRKTPKSYCAHNYAGSWLPKGSGLKFHIVKFLGKKTFRPILRLIYAITNRLHAKKLSVLSIPFDKEDK